MSYAQSWLDFENAAGGRFVLQGSAADMRKQSDDLAQVLLPQLPKPSENVESKDGEVDGIKYRLYNPKGVSGPLPVAIWTHGGGYVIGDINSDDLLCRVVSEHAKSIVVNIDYRLAPEHTWPTQLNDCLKVYKWAHDNASAIGGDPNEFYTIGGSAGGALALQICNAVLKDASLKHSIKGVAAMVPLVVHPDHVPDKYKSLYKAITENAKDVPIIDRNTIDTCYGYVKADGRDPSMWTLLDEANHKNFPPVYFTSCEFDPLRDDSYVMEAALKEAGVPTRHDHYKGLPHYFWIIPSVPEGQEYVRKLLAGIGWLQSQMK